MAPKAAIVIVHGSYHTPAPYHGLRKALESHGQLPCSVLKNLIADPDNPDFDTDPSSNPSHPPHSADSEVIKSLLKTLVSEESKKVLLVAHSSGGWSANESAIPEFQAEKRKEQGKEGGVLGIFYISAFLIEVAESLSGTYFRDSKDASDWITLHKSNLATVNSPPHFLFHDISSEEAKKWSKTLTACPFLQSPLTNDVYSAVPLAYLICEGDRVVPPTYQEMMVKGTQERSGRKIEVYRCRGGHEAFLSSTKFVADAVAEFANKNLS